MTAVRTEADVAAAVGEFRLLTMATTVFWVAELAIGCLAPLRLLLRLFAILGIWRACRGLRAMAPGFVAAEQATVALFVLRVGDAVLPIVPEFVFAIATVGWQWILLGAVHRMLLLPRPGLAVQVHILRWAFAVLVAIAWLDPGGLIGGAIVFAAFVGHALWVVAAMITLQQVERVVAMLLRTGAAAALSASTE